MTKRDGYYIGAIVILVIIGGMNYMKLLNLEERLYGLDNLQHEVATINNSMFDVSSQVQVQLEEFKAEQLWVQEKDYVITNVDIESNEVEVDLQWRMKELKEGEEVSFLYRGEDDKEWKKLQVNQEAGLNFSLTHTFPLKGNYITQVIAESDTGKRSEDLIELRFKEQIENRVMIDAFVHSFEEGHFDINININNSKDNEFFSDKYKEELDITNAKAFLYVGGKLIKEIDLLKESTDMHSDPYNEGLNYNARLNLKDEVGANRSDAQLRVVVEDGLGFKFESSSDAEKMME